jgi:hypothetical protein
MDNPNYRGLAIDMQDDAAQEDNNHEEEEKVPPDPGGFRWHKPKPVIDPRDERPASDSDDEDFEDKEELVSRMAIELIGKVSDRSVTETGLMSILDIVQRRMGPRSGMTIPKSYYGLQKAAGYNPKQHASCVWPLCACGKFAFPVGTTTCPVCFSNYPLDPEFYMAVFDVVGRLTKLMAVPAYAERFHYAANRDEDKIGTDNIDRNGESIGKDGDVWAAERLRNISAEDRLKFFWLRLSTDGTVMKPTFQILAVPIVAEVLNLPPDYRTRFGALLLFGLIPKEGDYHMLYLQLLQHNAAYFDGAVIDGVRADTGFKVHDAYTRSDRVSKFAIGFTVNYTKGHQPDLCSKQSPAEVGGCPFCDVLGLSRGPSKMIYPSFMSHLDVDDPMVLVMQTNLTVQPMQASAAMVQNELNGLDDAEDKARVAALSKIKRKRKRAVETVEHMLELCRCQPRPMRTTQEALAAARRVLQNPTESVRKQEPYFDISVYVKLIPDFDLLGVASNDPAHALDNLMKQIFLLVGNKGKMSTGKDAMDIDFLCGKFPEKGQGKFPFQASNGIHVEEIMRKYKSPRGWSKMRRPISKPTGMKMVESLRYLMDTGVYFLMCLDLEEEYQRILIELIQAARILLSKEPVSAAEWHEAMLELTRALAVCEVKLPFFWSHVVVHMLGHEDFFTQRFGSFPVRNMLDIERFHTVLKGMAHSGFLNFVATVAKKYNNFVETELSRLVGDAIQTAATQSSLAAVRPDPRRARARTVVPVGKALTIKRLTPQQFRSVLELWGRFIPELDKIVDSYKEYVGTQARERRKRDSFWNAASWKEWFTRKSVRARPKWSADVCRFKYIPGVGTFFSRALLDDTYFATAGFCKNLRYDNSGIEEDYNTWPNGPRAEPVPEKAYGQIIEMFTHCIPWMEKEALKGECELLGVLSRAQCVPLGADSQIHVPVDSELLPPGASDWTSKNSFACELCECKLASAVSWFQHKIGPEHRLRLAAPWTRRLVIDCDWYSPDPDLPCHPISRLPNVIRDEGLSVGARLNFLKDMYGHNIVLWPSKPWLRPDERPDSDSDSEQENAAAGKSWTVIRGRNLDTSGE